jgi:integrase
MNDKINQEPSTGAQASAKRYNFTKVKDSRGHQVNGLWERNGRFYYQLSVPGKGCRRVPLMDEENQPVKTPAQAIAAKNELLSKKRKGELPSPRRSPAFDEFVKHYLAWVEQTEAKSERTIESERWTLNGWADFLGSIRLTQITRRNIDDYVLKRKQEGVSNRTANLAVIALSNCLRFAKREGWLRDRLPTDDWEPLDYKAPKRPLRTREEIDRLCNEARRVEDGKPVYENGEMLVDYINLLAACGARRNSGLAIRWSDVDWNKRQLYLRKTKYSKPNVVVDFNPVLEEHLRSMFKRRHPDSDFLFPSRRTENGKERNMRTLRATYDSVKKEAGLPGFNLHDFRHYFISWCVMSNIDFMTIARWVSHSDGGVLIGRVYGHLANEHTQQAAKKLKFSVPAEEPKQPPAGNQVTLDLTKISAAELLKLLHQVQNGVGN